MEFREFLEEQEFKAFDEQMALEVNLLTVPKFVAGAAANAVTQAGRGVGNIVGGAAKSALGAARMGLGGLQMIGGGVEPGWDNVKAGWGAAQDAGLQIGKGVLQGAGVVTGATPLLRGAQAASEKITDISGIYSPKGKNSWQDIFGMNSWKKDSSESGVKNLERAKAAGKAVPSERRSGVSSKVSAEAREKALERQQLWLHLVAAYKSSRSLAEKKKLQDTIRKVFPEKYAEIMARQETKKIMDKK
jgi:hypothetical protein